MGARRAALTRARQEARRRRVGQSVARHEWMERTEEREGGARLIREERLRERHGLSFWSISPKKPPHGTTQLLVTKVIPYLANLGLIGTTK